MKNRFICAGVALTLAGCSNYSLLSLNEEKHDSANQFIQLYSSDANDSGMWRPKQVVDATNIKNINSYARGIMQDLLSNLQYVGSGTPLAVADFVYLNSDFNSSNVVGKQLAEAFSHEVHKLGIPVIDYKLTDYIRVTPKGSFALSKDFLELSDEMPIRYILTGTLVEDREGIIVNARIVGIESKAIVASAQGILPKKVTDSLTVEYSNDGLTY